MLEFQPSAFSNLAGEYGVATDSYLGGTSRMSWDSKVYAKPGVVWNDSLKSFASALASRLSFPLVVTSGVRTARAQAEALAQDYNFSVYSKSSAGLVAEIKSGGLSVSQMADTIQKQIDRGLFLSRHLRGDALDFRSRGLNSSELAQLKSAAASLGAEVEDEGDHVHVEGLSGSYISTATSVMPKVILWGSFVAVTVIAAHQLRRRWMARGR